MNGESNESEVVCLRKIRPRFRKNLLVSDVVIAAWHVVEIVEIRISTDILLGI